MTDKIMVTGCKGQLGRAINRICLGNKAFEMINTDVEDLDITSGEQVLRFVEQVKPYAIVNCAAFTSVDACETQPETAYRVNALGPENLAVAAEHVGARLIHISTDYVFSGKRRTPYAETDIPDPVSNYGRTKLAGEEAVKKICKKYFIIRTAWLYGNGKNFVRTMLRLAETQEEVSVVDDQFGSPTSAMELARGIAGLIPTDYYGIYHGVCKGVCSWAEFAEEIFRIAGKSTKVRKITTEEYQSAHPESAVRPMYSVLENRMFERTTGHRFLRWKSALEEYLL